ncbi:hypothetical protein PAMC26577_14080 [Caballeronia sordidicola]|uniref:Uncharacterized protein n=1 Tax=Caballeronia sordidicola TaxID=196367 RepID=A0A242MVG0_CABSO|nr:hypothetical protein PAMC26577_14080 [Caballeronia sordidicola]
MVFAFAPSHTVLLLGSMAYTLIRGTAAGTVIIEMFLPSLYAI